VLLLNMRDESASGANLTTANHAIFIHPLLTETQQEYEACETQAVGRVCRYGQERDVTIWRFLVTESMDTAIYQQRVENAGGEKA
jgi:SNF2 family DNA or RNA helicase